MFRNEFDAAFIAWFTFLLFLKVFHLLTADRVDYVCKQMKLSALFNEYTIIEVVELIFLVGFAVPIIAVGTDGANTNIRAWLPCTNGNVPLFTRCSGSYLYSVFRCICNAERTFHVSLVRIWGMHIYSWFCYLGNYTFDSYIGFSSPSASYGMC